MSCSGKIKVTLEHPIAYTNFLSYPVCGGKAINELACHRLAEVVFPSIVTTSTKQISVLGCDTNTLVFDVNGKPVLSSMLIANRPYPLHFCPILGGFVLTGFVCPTTVLTEEVTVKEVSKR
ncbi:MAG: hypothetical protein ACRDBY_00895 [Cetobacterium sp.]